MQQFYLRHEWKRSPSVSVGATVEICGKSVVVDFGVREAQSCFCQKKELDGENVCEDSCVEVFLRMLDKSNSYANFEFNSKGVCYAARGKDRKNRKQISKEEYAQIIRKPSGITMDNHFYRWNLSVEIPFSLLGADQSLNVFQLDGNLYKCADLAEEPHWLSAFPIKTPKPDFHRPEFFCCLNMDPAFF
ncbi:MAG: carbohydrate-binding family 9-like protein [Fibromonadales bacterium]|nr:carbohydrate-binding family 9-like protein [Fibromonadales bacterium]